MHIRPLTPDDVTSARALLAAEAESHPYAARARELLEAAAVAGDEGEYRALVARGEDEVIGLALYGLVAGSVGAGAVYALAVAPRRRRSGVGRALLDETLASLVGLGARVAVAELPEDEAAVGPLPSLLRRAGFVEEGRVPDLVRDGVAMTFWRRELLAA